MTSTKPKSPMSAHERAQRLINQSEVVHQGERPSIPTSRIGGSRGVLGRLQNVLGDARSYRLASVEPSRVRVWTLQGRLQESLNEETVADLINSIQASGQNTPAIVRPVNNDPDYDYEVIDGSRRRYACAQLGRTLQVLVADLTDKEAASLAETSDSTARHSAYEVGLRYRGWMEAGIVSTQDELAQFVAISKSRISVQLNLALVPREFLHALGGHDRVPKTMYLRLASLIAKAKASDRLDKVLEELTKVGRLHSGTGTPADVLLALQVIEAKFRRVPSTEPEPEEVRLKAGKPILRVKVVGRQGLQLGLSHRLPAEKGRALASAVADFVQSWLENAEQFSG